MNVDVTAVEPDPHGVHKRGDHIEYEFNQAEKVLIQLDAYQIDHLIVREIEGEIVVIRGGMGEPEIVYSEKLQEP